MKSREEILKTTAVADSRRDTDEVHEETGAYGDTPLLTEMDRHELIERLKKEMRKAAEDLEFEQAARIRDRIRNLVLEKENRKTNRVSRKVAKTAKNHF